MFRLKHIAICAIVVFACGALTFFIWSYRSVIAFNISKLMCSNETMIEKYFDVSLSEDAEIEQFSIIPDVREVKSSVLKAEITVNQSDVDKILRNYLRYNKISDSILTFLFNGWGYQGTVDFYIWRPSDVLYPGFPYLEKIQRDVYIFVSKPENGKCLIFFYKNRLGWNEK